MQWFEIEVAIKDLKEFSLNPRFIGKEEFERLVNSIKEDGFHQRLLVDKDLTIIGGHQRLKALKRAGFKETDLIKVLVPERKLTTQEFIRMNTRDNGSYGSWDFENLANLDIDVDTLIEWGIPEDLLPNFPIEDMVEDEIAKEEKVPTYKIELEFLNEADREKAKTKIENLGFQVKLL